MRYLSNIPNKHFTYLIHICKQYQMEPAGSLLDKSKYYMIIHLRGLNPYKHLLNPYFSHSNNKFLKRKDIQFLLLVNISVLLFRNILKFDWKLVYLSKFTSLQLFSRIMFLIISAYFSSMAFVNSSFRLWFLSNYILWKRKYISIY